MGEAIGEILTLAVAVAINPIPIAAVILMLRSRRGGTNGIAFLIGWVVGLAAVGAVVLVFGSASSSDGDPSTASGIVRAAFGVLFIGIAVRSWRRRPARGEDPRTPHWMEAIDTFGALRSFGVALLLSAVNPKSLGLTIAAASTIAAAELRSGEEIAVFAIFLLIASSTIAGPLAYYALARARARATLDHLQTWLIANNNVIIAVLLLVIGAKLLGDGISILSG